MNRIARLPRLAGALFALVPLLAGPAQAVDGVIEINQAAALAGGITILDAPGFPITLSERGSYRLTSELNVPTDATGILIQNEGITIDLNGFAIVGAGGTTGSGVFGSTAAGVRVYNGAVRNMAEHGVRLGDRASVHDVLAADNGLNGIWVGYRSIIRNCQAISNDFIGISALFARVESSVASSNGDVGIRSTTSVIQNNVVTSNGGFGIEAGGDSIVTGNTIRANGDLGISGAASTGFGQNTLRDNGSGHPDGQVSSAITPLGTNLCAGAVCP